MSDPAEPLSALADMAQAETFGALGPDGPGVILGEHRPRAIVHLASRAAAALSEAVQTAVGVGLPVEPNRVLSNDRVAALWLAPERWLIVSERHDPAALEAALGATSGAVNEATSGRTRIRVAGPKARALLARGCPMDLHPAEFRDGHCAQSLMGQISVLLHAVDDGAAIDLYVARGLAASLWHFLVERGGQFGCELRPPAAG